ncbi:sulfatase [Rhodococcus triatomae]|uniref:Arylsulfatase A n=1 Tax=Rhodococcus triatomae TaxID=300028 RepID=A0A1G8I8Q5_9NOCA|nr:sulfatase [Rhodococcus triatomae]QNG20987.1 sulfatase [Rhodococcus triatomae]QNG23098.1 sulfatase [Rhodococcus triatomae]SDI15227.1 Arylsulfatase A [Rhodococcus triatomae]
MTGIDAAAVTGADTTRENVLLVHWHDLGRHLELYGASGAKSPALDALAAEGVLLTRAHATAPLCSPSRGSLLTGRYPHSNGVVGLAHHGWEYREGVRTLPQLLGEQGWSSALFGMQHESATPGRLGYDEFDVTDSDCDYVVDRAQEWLHEAAERRRAGDDSPFLLNTGFFEVHRPYSPQRYPVGDPHSFDVPSYLPDTADVRADLAAFHGSIEVADAATGRLLDALEESGFAEDTWVVFFTDHGEAFPGAKSTLYDRGTGISFIVRPPRSRSVSPVRYDGLFSGVDLVPTLLELLGVDVPEDVDGVSHAAVFAGSDRDTEVRDAVFTQKNYHDSYDPIRAIRTAEFSYIENFASRSALELPLDIADSPSGRAIGRSHRRPRSARELYDLRVDPGEQHNLAGDAAYADIEQVLADRLFSWRVTTGDAVTGDAEGSAIAAEFMRRYRAALAGKEAVPRSPKGRDRQFRDARPRAATA